MLLFKSTFGKRYRVFLPKNGTIPGKIKSEQFSDTIASRRFLLTLNTNENALRHLNYQVNGRSPYLAEQSNPIEQISHALVRGKIKFVEVPDIGNPNAQMAIIPLGHDSAVRITPAAELLTSPAKGITHFAQLREACEYIESLNPDDGQLGAIAERLNIPVSASQSRPHTIEAIGKAVTDGEAVVLVEKQPGVKPPAGAEPELAQSEPGNRSVGLGPEISPEPVEEVCGVCVAKSFVVQCGHKRAPGPDNKIQVVPSPDSTASREIALMGVKVEVKREFGGKEVISGALSLKNNKFSSCFETTNTRGAWVTGANAKVQVEGNTEDEPELWPINAAPTLSVIKGKGCSGAPKSVTIETFPNQYHSVEGQLDIFQDWAKKVNEGWETWGKKFFDLSPVSLTPKVTGPTGSFAAAWGWKENSDWRAYYDINASFGLNPILGVEIEIAVSLVKVGLAAAGIPPSLSDLGTKHLADINVFGSAGCKGMLTGSPHAKYFADGSSEYDGQAKFTIEGAVKIGLRGRIGSDYVVSAALILYGETKVTGEDVLELNRDGAFAQTTINIDPLTAVAQVEVKYLLIFTDKKEKKWTPWEQIELYKSDKKKIFPR